MNIFEHLLINFIYLIFPLLLYLLYQIYSKTLSKEKNELYLDIALISSFYLMTEYGILEKNMICYLLLNIPLIIAYIKKRYLSISFLSTMIVIYYYEQLQISIVWLVLEYVLYFIIYLLLKKNDKYKIEVLNLMLFIKCGMFFLQLLIYNQFRFEVSIIFISIILFYIETIILLSIMRKTEDIIKLHRTIQELQEEKQVRESLFKITHEIKNPIAVCKGYMDMFDVNNVEHSRKYIPIIKSEIDRVLILLQDFLSITKVKVELDIIDLNLLLENVIDSFIPLIKECKINIKSNIEDDELYLMADYNRLSQVIINLIKNSIEAIEDNGEIEVLVTENKNTVIIKVKDNGSGISSENLKRMNEPFFTTKNNGTGLGVYLSTEIIKAHGGSLKYKSNKNGTIATITLPNKKGY